MDNIENDLAKIKNPTKDTEFKKLASYKAITAILIRATIPEYRNLELKEIAKLIENDRARSPKIDVLKDMVDELPTESGTLDEKNIRMDFVFKIKLPDKENKYIIIDTATVDFEMQQKVKKSELGYNLVSRGIYYGCRLLCNTVPSSDTYYTNIHKVYSIWFCNSSLDGVIDLSKKEFKEIKNECIHRYNFRRNYYPVIDKVVKAEKESDLVEVVFIDLKKLLKTFDHNKDNNIERSLLGVFYEREKVRDYMIKIIKNEQEFEESEVVNIMSLYEQGIQEARQEAVEEANINRTIRSIDKSMAKNKDAGIVKVAKYWVDFLELSEQEAKAVYRHYKIKTS